MIKVLIAQSLLCMFSLVAFSQSKFSDETKKYIAYSDSLIVLKNALLIDGNGNQPKSGQTIVIRKGKISWVGDDNNAVIPSTATIINLNGKAVLPGFNMLHEHMFTSAFSFDPMHFLLKQLPISFPRLYLAAGVTSIRTCGSIEPYSDLRIKKDIDAGTYPGPYIDLTAPYAEQKEPGMDFPQMKEIKTPAEAVRFVNFWADEGFTSFKIYSGADKSICKAVIETAHKRHLKVTGHLCQTTYADAAELEIDNLEHGFYAGSDFVGTNTNYGPCPVNVLYSLLNLNINSDIVNRTIRQLINKKTGITSTLAVFEGLNNIQLPPSNELLDMFSPDSKNYYLEQLKDIKPEQGPSGMDSVFNTNAKLEKKFYDMGGLLTVGTDPTGNGGTIAGIGSWRAIELLVLADGFTPLQAIKIATLNGAIALGRAKTTGSIEAGKSADILIIDGDPSKNISDIRKVQFVFRNGIGYDSKKIFDSMKGKVGFY
ncbi:amidohydrolase family protein [Pinibacter soli]|uniref:Amidohydrolase family protein n=1 Tax=Pinibacter soli TaxID=3044211 RepID=A0ABT6RE93_9BACT|nr:amidohydrolase family protein [Pinibacter soli]MDI3320902.1 amidohydrolase family protein [Pinibacter soli]